MTVTVRYPLSHAYTPLQVGTRPRPYVPVRLEVGGRYFDTPALVDSGADSALFNLQIARMLGLALDPANAASTLGVGGHAAAWYFDIHVTAFGRRFPARIGFSTGIPPAHGLLGRAEFFRQFQVGFDEVGQQLLLRPY